MGSDAPTENGTVKLAACDNCGRSFAEDRLDTHFNICVNQKERKPFNVARKRVEGTEAEDMLKAGKLFNLGSVGRRELNFLFVQGRLKLEKPKPDLSKSELTKKTLAKEPLPPIKTKDQKQFSKHEGYPPAKCELTVEAAQRLRPFQYWFIDSDW